MKYSSSSLAVILDSGGGESSSTVDLDKSNGFGMYDNWAREPMVLSVENTMLCKNTMQQKLLYYLE